MIVRLAVVGRRLCHLHLIVVKAIAERLGLPVNAFEADPRAAALLRARQPALFHGAVGIVITAVYADNQGQQLGLRIGDILVKYGSRVLNESDDLTTASRDAKKATTLTLIRDKKQVTVTVEPGKLGIQVEDL